MISLLIWQYIIVDRGKPPLLLHIFSLLLHVQLLGLPPTLCIECWVSACHIPWFNKTSLLCKPSLKDSRGDRGWKESPREGEDMMTLRRKTVIMSKTNSWLMYWKMERKASLCGQVRRKREARDFWHANKHKELLDNWTPPAFSKHSFQSYPTNLNEVHSC